MSRYERDTDGDSTGFTTNEEGGAIDERAFWTSPGRGEIRPVTLAAPGPGEVRVRTLRSGISRGTETLVFRGAVPADQHERMRAPHQDCLLYTSDAADE